MFGNAIRVASVAAITALSASQTAATESSVDWNKLVHCLLLSIQCRLEEDEGETKEKGGKKKKRKKEYNGGTSESKLRESLLLA